ncbi:peptidase [Streptomyces phage Ibantik]|uniref:Peptidase n=1 Tax=Streptomyces phage Ibantik TaxID=2182397 RepID=A0A2U8UNU6_9CAUD|nr:peptidase [Streptomyces phage Ibantik]AWN05283.1 peptidase [Streptomyces phage Ibantik]
MTEPMVGDFGLTKISGLAGAFVSFGQWFVGDFAPVQHALVYVGDGMVVQAMPSGAELIRLEDASPVVKWSTGLIHLTDEKREEIADEAYGLVGTPYSFLDYVSIALERLGIRPRWVLERVAGSERLICSQLVTLAYERAGVQLFSDGRFPGDVTPGDLYLLLKEGRGA